MVDSGIRQGEAAGTDDGLIGLTCPNCRTGYKINPQSLGRRGRKVRCTTCGHRWSAAPDGTVAPAAPKAPAAEQEASDADAETTGAEADEAVAADPPARAPASIGPVVSWLALLLVALILVGAVVGRGAVLRALPQTAWFYGRLGLPVTVPVDLDLDAIEAVERLDGGVPYLDVTAEIRNATGGGRDVPPLVVSVLDAGRGVLRQERILSPQPRLPPGGTVRVRGRVALPEKAASYEIDFVPQEVP